MPIYRAIYDGPPRWFTNQKTRKKYVMIHATANNATAENEASYAKRRPDSTSSHYYVDDDSIVQSLDTDLRAWHAGNTEGNDHAIAYELTAQNVNVGRAWWLDTDNIEWPLFADQVAKDCEAHGITPRTLTDAQLRVGSMTGIITHVQGNRVWGGSDHTDPGPNFPMDYLVSQVKKRLEGATTVATLNKSDVNVLANTDGVIKAPASSLRENPNNKFWTLGSFLRSIRDATRPAITKAWKTIWPNESGNTTVGVAARRAAIIAHRARAENRVQFQAVLAEVAELRGQVAGLTALVQQLLTAPPVQLTAEQLATLTETVAAAAREPGERIEAALAAAGAGLLSVADDDDDDDAAASSE